MRSKNSSTGQELSFIEEARRAQIIAAAIEVVAEAGYAQASLARIAEHAKISKSVISYHFAGKDDLLTQVVMQVFHSGWEHAEPLLNSQQSAAGKLRAWITSHLSYMESHRNHLLALGGIISNHLADDGRSRYAEEIATGTQMLAGIVRAGQESGEFRHCDAQVVAVTIGNAIEGALQRWVTDPATDLSAYGQELVTLFDRALAND